MFFVKRLKYARVTRRKTFLHTNLHRAKNQKRKVCAQLIRLVQDLAERAFPKLFFGFCFSIHCGDMATFICLGRSSRIATMKWAYGFA